MDRSCTEGIILLNKAQGLTSFSAMRQVQRLLGVKKAGHTGSLDPLATGMLPICLGEATKFAQWLLADNKTYLATGLLGMTTTTGDAWGDPLETRAVADCSRETIEAVLPAFRGTLDQIPPMYSALKYHGQPLYRLARKGQTVERAPRQIHIEELSLLAVEGNSFQVRVRCSKGTYIRSLIEAIGEALGVGAHVTQLHRVSVEEFAEESMFSLEELTALTVAERWARVLPSARAVASLPRATVTLAQRQALYQGKVIGADQWDQSRLIFQGRHPEACTPQDDGPGKSIDSDPIDPMDAIGLWDEAGQFFGVGRWDETIGGLRAKRLYQNAS